VVTADPAHAATVGVVTETNAEKAIEELKAYEVSHCIPQGLLDLTGLAQQVLECLVADRQMWPLCFARAGCMSSLPVS